MKNLFVALFLSLFLSALAFADCNSDLGINFPFNQSQAVCGEFSTAITQSEIPATTNSIDLGSATKAWRYLFLNGLNVPTALEEAVAGAGTTVADAAALAGGKTLHQLTGANGTVGWKFVTATPVNSLQLLLNTTAGVPKIYGESGSTCNGGAADAACTLTTGIMFHVCWKSAALTYICA